VAVRDASDVVIASDGRVLGEDLRILSEASLKTMALNRNLCLGIAGYSESIRQVLRCLGAKCRKAHAIDLLTACQENDCPIDIDYDDAQAEISTLLQWMIRRTPAVKRSETIPAVVLAGAWRETPALCSWNAPQWRAASAPLIGFFDAAVGTLPDCGSPERERFQRLVRAERTTEEAEARLAQAIRLCARHFGAHGPINDTVFVRRLSEGFTLSRAD